MLPGIIKLARDRPSSWAVWGDRQRITWAELAGNSIALSRRLPPSSQHEAIAVLCTRQEPEFLIGLLAAWLAGYSVLPVPGCLTAREIENLRQELGRVDLFLLSSSIDQSIAQALSSWEIKPVVFCAQEEQVEAETSDIDSRWEQLPERRIGLWLFTSGSTGAPKVVGFRFSELLAAARIDAPHFAGMHAIVNLRPLSTSGGINSLWPSLIHGISLRLSDDLLAKPRLESVLAAMKETNADALIASPSFLRTALLCREGTGKLEGRSSKLFFGGGRLLDPELAALRECGFTPTMRYGFTECAHVLSLLPFPPRQSFEPGLVGLPLPEVQWRIENSLLKVLAPGLAIARRLNGITIPLLSADGWFMSDDLGELTTGGALILKGREYQQITSAGFRFLPAEVEEVILASGLVRDTIVAPQADDLYGERAVAWVVPAEGVDAETLLAKLEQFLKLELSRHKRPFRITVVKEIPRSASGKALRNFFSILPENER